MTVQIPWFPDPAWHLVEDSLPADGEAVLCIVEHSEHGRYVASCWRAHGKWWRGGAVKVEVRAWIEIETTRQVSDPDHGNRILKRVTAL